MSRATIRDVAREANVSIATVSRVLNHANLVDARTEERVREVMDRIDFTPSQVARNLSKQESNVIGVVIPEIDNPFYGKILRTVANRAAEHETSVLCFDTGNDPARDLRALRLVRENRVRGLLYAPSVEFGGERAVSECRRALDLLKAPVVVMDREISVLGRDGVYLNNFAAGFLPTKVLAAAGHRRIGIITGKNSIGISRERLRGYLAALESAQIEVDPTLVAEGDFSTETARQLATTLLKMRDRPTAIVAANNTTTLGVFQASTELGLDIQSDLDLFGIDSLDEFDSVGIPYNHVTRNREGMALAAVELLSATTNIDSDSKPTRVVFEPGFVMNERLRQAWARSSLGPLSHTAQTKLGRYNREKRKERPRNGRDEANSRDEEHQQVFRAS